jgi:hypothetical protein
MGGRVLIPVTGPANQTLAVSARTSAIQGPAGLPYLNVGSGFSTGNPNAGPVTGSNNYELRDVVSITKGKHNLSLGGEFALDKTMFAANLNNYGDVTFSTSAPTSTGNAIADFITGQVNSFEQDTPYITHLSTWHTAAFAQDNYRITPRFTANLGLRWDIDTPPVEAHNRTAYVCSRPAIHTVTPTAPLGSCSLGTKACIAAIIGTQFATFRLVSVLHGIHSGTARPPFVPQRASSTAIPAAMSGTSPATPCLSPFATALATKHPCYIYDVGFPGVGGVGNCVDAPHCPAGGNIFPYTFSRRLRNSIRAKH